MPKSLRTGALRVLASAFVLFIAEGAAAQVVIRDTVVVRSAVGTRTRPAPTAAPALFSAPDPTDVRYLLLAVGDGEIWSRSANALGGNLVVRGTRPGGESFTSTFGIPQTLVEIEARLDSESIQNCTHLYRRYTRRDADSVMADPGLWFDVGPFRDSVTVTSTVTHPSWEEQRPRTELHWMSSVPRSEPQWYTCEADWNVLETRELWINPPQLEVRDRYDRVYAGSDVRRQRADTLALRFRMATSISGGDTAFPRRYFGERRARLVLDAGAERVGSLTADGAPYTGAFEPLLQLERRSFQFVMHGTPDDSLGVSPVVARVCIEAEDPAFVFNGAIYTENGLEPCYLVAVGGVDYDLSATADTIRQGERAPVHLRPVFENGSAATLPDDALVHAITLQGGWTPADDVPTEAYEPPEGSPPGPSGASGPSGAERFVWRFTPGEHEVSPCAPGSAGRWVYPDSLGGAAVTGIEAGCDAAGLPVVTNVPYRLLREGLLEFEAATDGPEGQVWSGAFVAMSEGDDGSWTDRSAGTTPVVLAPPDVRLVLLRQDDTEIPSSGAEAFLMVSRKVTDRDFEAGPGFVSNYAPRQGKSGQGDGLGTFRPHMRGVPSGSAVSFRVTVGDSYDAMFGAVEGPLEDGGVAYRGDEFLRLVSNRKDDEHGGQRTIRAKLEDEVCVRAIVNEVVVGGVRCVRVGRPASEAGPHAVRRVETVWHTYSGARRDARRRTDAMSETWAQAGIYFKVKRDSVFGGGDVQNVVRVRGEPTKGAGTLGVEVQRGASKEWVIFAYEEGQSALTLSNALAQRLRDELGLSFPDVVVFPAETEDEGRGQLVSPARAEAFYVVIGRGGQFSITDVNNGRYTDVSRGTIETNDLRTHDLSAAALNVNDGDATTLDVVVVPANTTDGSLYGKDGRSYTVKGKAFTVADGRAGEWTSGTLFVLDEAADNGTAWPFVLSHEVGHVLGLGHVESAHNLMRDDTLPTDAISAPKRLDAAQAEQTRLQGARLLKSLGRQAP